eukprot:CCRYP_007535-RB/>CCRYP_007535-RB protein AED:0.22 eAED:0.23 QI:2050/1/0.8/1/0.5/0.4/5/0/381
MRAMAKSTKSQGLVTTWQILLLLFRCNDVLSDFSYPDFNKTAGLVFNGAAAGTDCGETSEFVAIGGSEENAAPKIDEYGLTATTDLFSITETASNNSKTDNTEVYDAIFGHREDFEIDANTGCTTRLRLTPSHPSKAGSVWYESRVPIMRGFETTFSWQITNQSKVCTEHVDRSYATTQHRSCAVHGGDGFAFVIHGAREASFALGGDGSELGYGGIMNSLAIEFDTWTNVDTQGSDDIFQDHISIHSAGSMPNSSNQSTSLGYWRSYNIADGKVHKCLIQYLPHVETRYFELMTANENLIPYLKDNGEGRRLGTLAVFVDQGIPENRPLLAIPVNLSLLLNVTQSLAYVGFTASTGRKWEIHDILSWEWATMEIPRSELD